MYYYYLPSMTSALHASRLHDTLKEMSSERRGISTGCTNTVRAQSPALASG